MPIGANRYYSDPTIGKIGSNLATAIFGNPEDRLKKGLYDAQTGYYGAEADRNRADTGRLNAEADKLREETRAQRGLNDGQDNLENAIKMFSAPIPGESPQDTMTRNAPAVAAFMRAHKGNTQEASTALGNIWSSLYGQGDPDQVRRGLSMQGKMPDQNFSPTGAIADANATRNSNLKTAEDVAREAEANRGAADRNVYTQGQENARNAVNEKGRNQRFYDTPIQTGPNAITTIPATNPNYPTLGARIMGRTDTSANKPAEVSANDLEDAIASAAQQIPGATIPTKDGKFVINPEFEASFPPQKIMQARTQAANVLQTTRNAQSAVAAYMQVLGIQPGATFKGAHSTTFTGRLFSGDTAKPAGIVPPVGAAPQTAATPAPPMGGAPAGYTKAPDGNFYRPDPARPGKFLMLQQ